MDNTDPPRYRLRLFVSGDTPNSVQALVNIQDFCRTKLKDCDEVEVVDVFREPGRALKEGIFMTPTLVKISPAPVVKIVGTLASTEKLLEAFGLKASP